MREAYFHEDDYRQVEILPLENLEFCKSELSEIRAFSEQHRDGIGWSDIRVREDNPSELVSMSLAFYELDEQLQKDLLKFDKVYTGYSSERTLCDHTSAYGSEESGVLFTEISDEGLVSAIWFSGVLPNLPEALKNRGLLYVDWEFGFLCAVDESEKYESYAREKSEVIREAMVEWEKEFRKNKPWWKFW